jgi:hypothetical protein
MYHDWLPPWLTAAQQLHLASLSKDLCTMRIRRDLQRWLFDVGRFDRDRIAVCD